MAVSLAPTFGVGYQAFTSGGLPLNGGLINTFIAGGTTPQATYTSVTGGTSNANPIVLASDGRPPSEIWLTDGVSYRFDLTDSLGTLIKSYDNISGLTGSAGSTGTGALVLQNTPTLITPVIGAATGTSLVLSGALTAGSVSTAGLLSTTGGTATITTAGANTGAALNLLGWTSGGKNWEINVDGSTAGLKFLASTAAGGSTFTTALMSLSEAGSLSLAANIGLGGTAPTTSGTGISFPATQSASTDVNTLDDYEEGSATATLTGTATYNSRSMTYTKIGNRVAIETSINVLLIGTGSTTTIGGNPFTSSSHVAMAVVSSSFANTVVSVCGDLPSGQSNIQLFSRTAAAVADSAATALFANGAFATVSGTFPI